MAGIRSWEEVTADPAYQQRSEAEKLQTAKNYERYVTEKTGKPPAQRPQILAAREAAAAASAEREEGKNWWQSNVYEPLTGQTDTTKFAEQQEAGTNGLWAQGAASVDSLQGSVQRLWGEAAEALDWKSASAYAMKRARQNEAQSESVARMTARDVHSPLDIPKYMAYSLAGSGAEALGSIGLSAVPVIGPAASLALMGGAGYGRTRAEQEKKGFNPDGTRVIDDPMLAATTATIGALVGRWGLKMGGNWGSQLAQKTGKGIGGVIGQTVKGGLAEVPEEMTQEALEAYGGGETRPGHLLYSALEGGAGGMAGGGATGGVKGAFNVAIGNTEEGAASASRFRSLINVDPSSQGRAKAQEAANARAIIRGKIQEARDQGRVLTEAEKAEMVNEQLKYSEGATIDAFGRVMADLQKDERTIDDNLMDDYMRKNVARVDEGLGMGAARMASATGFTDNERTTLASQQEGLDKQYSARKRVVNDHVAEVESLKLQATGKAEALRAEAQKAYTDEEKQELDLLAKGWEEEAAKLSQQAVDVNKMFQHATEATSEQGALRSLQAMAAAYDNEHNTNLSDTLDDVAAINVMNRNLKNSRAARENNIEARRGAMGIATFAFGGLPALGAQVVASTLGGRSVRKIGKKMTQAADFSKIQSGVAPGATGFNVSMGDLEARARSFASNALAGDASRKYYRKGTPEEQAAELQKRQEIARATLRTMRSTITNFERDYPDTKKTTTLQLMKDILADAEVALNKYFHKRDILDLNQFDRLAAEFKARETELQKVKGKKAVNTDKQMFEEREARKTSFRKSAERNQRNQEIDSLSRDILALQERIPEESKQDFINLSAQDFEAKYPGLMDMMYLIMDLSSVHKDMEQAQQSNAVYEYTHLQREAAKILVNARKAARKYPAPPVKRQQAKTKLQEENEAKQRDLDLADARTELKNFTDKNPTGFPQDVLDDLKDVLDDAEQQKDTDPDLFKDLMKAFALDLEAAENTAETLGTSKEVTDPAKRAKIQNTRLVYTDTLQDRVNEFAVTHPTVSQTVTDGLLDQIIEMEDAANAQDDSAYRLAKNAFEASFQNAKIKHKDAYEKPQTLSALAEETAQRTANLEASALAITDLKDNTTATDAQIKELKDDLALLRQDLLSGNKTSFNKRLGTLNKKISNVRKQVTKVQPGAALTAGMQQMEDTNAYDKLAAEVDEIKELYAAGLNANDDYFLEQALKNVEANRGKPDFKTHVRILKAAMDIVKRRSGKPADKKSADVLQEETTIRENLLRSVKGKFKKLKKAHPEADQQKMNALEQMQEELENNLHDPLKFKRIMNVYRSAYNALYDEIRGEYKTTQDIKDAFEGELTKYREEYSQAVRDEADSREEYNNRWYVDELGERWTVTVQEDSNGNKRYTLAKDDGSFTSYSDSVQDLEITISSKGLTHTGFTVEENLDRHAAVEARMQAFYEPSTEQRNESAFIDKAIEALNKSQEQQTAQNEKDQEARDKAYNKAITDLGKVLVGMEKETLMSFYADIMEAFGVTPVDIATLAQNPDSFKRGIARLVRNLRNKQIQMTTDLQALDPNDPGVVDPALKDFAANLDDRLYVTASDPVTGKPISVAGRDVMQEIQDILQRHENLQMSYTMKMMDAEITDAQEQYTSILDSTLNLEPSAALLIRGLIDDLSDIDTVDNSLTAARRELSKRIKTIVATLRRSSKEFDQRMSMQRKDTALAQAIYDEQEKIRAKVSDKFDPEDHANIMEAIDGLNSANSLPVLQHEARAVMASLLQTPSHRRQILGKVLEDQAKRMNEQATVASEMEVTSFLDPKEAEAANKQLLASTLRQRAVGPMTDTEVNQWVDTYYEAYTKMMQDISDSDYTSDVKEALRDLVKSLQVQTDITKLRTGIDLVKGAISDANTKDLDGIQENLARQRIEARARAAGSELLGGLRAAVRRRIEEISKLRFALSNQDRQDVRDGKITLEDLDLMDHIRAQMQNLRNTLAMPETIQQMSTQDLKQIEPIIGNLVFAPDAVAADALVKDILAAVAMAPTGVDIAQHIADMQATTQDWLQQRAEAVTARGSLSDVELAAANDIIHFVTLFPQSTQLEGKVLNKVLSGLKATDHLLRNIRLREALEMITSEDWVNGATEAQKLYDAYYSNISPVNRTKNFAGQLIARNEKIQTHFEDVKAENENLRNASLWKGGNKPVTTKVVGGSTQNPNGNYTMTVSKEGGTYRLKVVDSNGIERYNNLLGKGPKGGDLKRDSAYETSYKIMEDIFLEEAVARNTAKVKTHAEKKTATERAKSSKKSGGFITPDLLFKGALLAGSALLMATPVFAAGVDFVTNVSSHLSTFVASGAAAASSLTLLHYLRGLLPSSTRAVPSTTNLTSQLSDAQIKSMVDKGAATARAELKKANVVWRKPKSRKKKSNMEVILPDGYKLIHNADRSTLIVRGPMVDDVGREVVVDQVPQIATREDALQYYSDIIIPVEIERQINEQNLSLENVNKLADEQKTLFQGLVDLFSKDKPEKVPSNPDYIRPIERKGALDRKTETASTVEPVPNASKVLSEKITGAAEIKTFEKDFGRLAAMISPWRNAKGTHNLTGEPRDVWQEKVDAILEAEKFDTPSLGGQKIIKGTEDAHGRSLFQSFSTGQAYRYETRVNTSSTRDMPFDVAVYDNETGALITKAEVKNNEEAMAIFNDAKEKRARRTVNEQDLSPDAKKDLEELGAKFVELVGGKPAPVVKPAQKQQGSSKKKTTQEGTWTVTRGAPEESATYARDAGGYKLTLSTDRKDGFFIVSIEPKGATQGEGTVRHKIPREEGRALTDQQLLDKSDDVFKNHLASLKKEKEKEGTVPEGVQRVLSSPLNATDNGRWLIEGTAEEDVDVSSYGVRKDEAGYTAQYAVLRRDEDSGTGDINSQYAIFDPSGKLILQGTHKGKLSAAKDVTDFLNEKLLTVSPAPEKAASEILPFYVPPPKAETEADKAVPVTTVGQGRPARPQPTDSVRPEGVDPRKKITEYTPEEWDAFQKKLEEADQDLAAMLPWKEAGAQLSAKENPDGSRSFSNQGFTTTIVTPPGGPQGSLVTAILTDPDGKLIAYTNKMFAFSSASDQKRGAKLYMQGVRSKADGEQTVSIDSLKPAGVASSKKFKTYTKEEWDLFKQVLDSHETDLSAILPWAKESNAPLKKTNNPDGSKSFTSPSGFKFTIVTTPSSKRVEVSTGILQAPDGTLVGFTHRLPLRTNTASQERSAKFLMDEMRVDAIRAQEASERASEGQQAEQAAKTPEASEDTKSKAQPMDSLKPEGIAPSKKIRHYTPEEWKAFKQEIDSSETDLNQIAKWGESSSRDLQMKDNEDGSHTYTHGSGITVTFFAPFQPDSGAKVTEVVQAPDGTVIAVNHEAVHRPVRLQKASVNGRLTQLFEQNKANMLNATLPEIKNDQGFSVVIAKEQLEGNSPSITYAIHDKNDVAIREGTYDRSMSVEDAEALLRSELQRITASETEQDKEPEAEPAKKTEGSLPTAPAQVQQPEAPAASTGSVPVRSMSNRGSQAGKAAAKKEAQVAETAVETSQPRRAKSVDVLKPEDMNTAKKIEDYTPQEWAEFKANLLKQEPDPAALEQLRGLSAPARGWKRKNADGSRTYVAPNGFKITFIRSPWDKVPTEDIGSDYKYHYAVVQDASDNVVFVESELDEPTTPAQWHSAVKTVVWNGSYTGKMGIITRAHEMLDLPLSERKDKNAPLYALKPVKVANAKPFSAYTQAEWNSFEKNVNYLDEKTLTPSAKQRLDLVNKLQHDNWVENADGSRTYDLGSTGNYRFTYAVSPHDPNAVVASLTGNGSILLATSEFDPNMSDKELTKQMADLLELPFESGKDTSPASVQKGAGTSLPLPQQKSEAPKQVLPSPTSEFKPEGVEADTPFEEYTEDQWDDFIGNVTEVPYEGMWPTERTKKLLEEYEIKSSGWETNADGSHTYSFGDENGYYTFTIATSPHAKGDVYVNNVLEKDRPYAAAILKDPKGTVRAVDLDFDPRGQQGDWSQRMIEVLNGEAAENKPLPPFLHPSFSLSGENQGTEGDAKAEVEADVHVEPGAPKPARAKRQKAVAPQPMDSFKPADIESDKLFEDYTQAEWDAFENGLQAWDKANIESGVDPFTQDHQDHLNRQEFKHRRWLPNADGSFTSKITKDGYTFTIVDSHRAYVTIDEDTGESRQYSLGILKDPEGNILKVDFDFPVTGSGSRTLHMRRSLGESVPLQELDSPLSQRPQAPATEAVPESTGKSPEEIAAVQAEQAENMAALEESSVAIEALKDTLGRDAPLEMEGHAETEERLATEYQNLRDAYAKGESDMADVVNLLLEMYALEANLKAADAGARAASIAEKPEAPSAESVVDAAPEQQDQQAENMAALEESSLAIEVLKETLEREDPLEMEEYAELERRLTTTYNNLRDAYARGESDPVKVESLRIEMQVLEAHLKDSVSNARADAIAAKPGAPQQREGTPEAEAFMGQIEELRETFKSYLEGAIEALESEMAKLEEGHADREGLQEVIFAAETSLGQLNLIYQNAREGLAAGTLSAAQQEELLADMRAVLPSSLAQSETTTEAEAEPASTERAESLAAKPEAPSASEPDVATVQEQQAGLKATLEKVRDEIGELEEVIDEEKLLGIEGYEDAEIQIAEAHRKWLAAYDKGESTVEDQQALLLDMIALRNKLEEYAPAKTSAPVVQPKGVVADVEDNVEVESDVEKALEVAEKEVKKNQWVNHEMTTPENIQVKYEESLDEAGNDIYVYTIKDLDTPEVEPITGTLNAHRVPDPRIPLAAKAKKLGQEKTAASEVEQEVDEEPVVEPVVMQPREGWTATEDGGVSHTTPEGYVINIKPSINEENSYDYSIITPEYEDSPSAVIADTDRELVSPEDYTLNIVKDQESKLSVKREAAKVRAEQRAKTPETKPAVEPVQEVEAGVVTPEETASDQWSQDGDNVFSLEAEEGIRAVYTQEPDGGISFKIQGTDRNGRRYQLDKGSFTAAELPSENVRPTLEGIVKGYVDTKKRGTKRGPQPRSTLKPQQQSQTDMFADEPVAEVAVEAEPEVSVEPADVVEPEAPAETDVAQEPSTSSDNWTADNSLTTEDGIRVSYTMREDGGVDYLVQEVNKEGEWQNTVRGTTPKSKLENVDVREVLENYANDLSAKKRVKDAEAANRRAPQPQSTLTKPISEITAQPEPEVVAESKPMLAEQVATTEAPRVEQAAPETVIEQQSDVVEEGVVSEPVETPVAAGAIRGPVRTLESEDDIIGYMAGQIRELGSAANTVPIEQRAAALQRVRDKSLFQQVTTEDADAELQKLYPDMYAEEDTEAVQDQEVTPETETETAPAAVKHSTEPTITDAQGLYDSLDRVAQVIGDKYGVEITDDILVAAFRDLEGDFRESIRNGTGLSDAHVAAALEVPVWSASDRGRGVLSSGPESIIQSGTEGGKRDELPLTSLERKARLGTLTENDMRLWLNHNEASIEEYLGGDFDGLPDVFREELVHTLLEMQKNKRLQQHDMDSLYDALVTEAQDYIEEKSKPLPIISPEELKVQIAMELNTRANVPEGVAEAVEQRLERMQAEGINIEWEEMDHVINTEMSKAGADGRDIKSAHGLQETTGTDIDDFKDALEQAGVELPGSLTRVRKTGSELVFEATPDPSVKSTAKLTYRVAVNPLTGEVTIAVPKNKGDLKLPLSFFQNKNGDIVAKKLTDAINKLDKRIRRVTKDNKRLEDVKNKKLLTTASDRALAKAIEEGTAVEQTLEGSEIVKGGVVESPVQRKGDLTDAQVQARDVLPPRAHFKPGIPQPPVIMSNMGESYGFDPSNGEPIPGLYDDAGFKQDYLTEKQIMQGFRVIKGSLKTFFDDYLDTPQKRAAYKEPFLEFLRQDPTDKKRKKAYDADTSGYFSALIAFTDLNKRTAADIIRRNRGSKYFATQEQRNKFIEEFTYTFDREETWKVLERYGLSHHKTGNKQP